MARVILLVWVAAAVSGCGKDAPSGKPGAEAPVVAVRPGPTAAAESEWSSATLDEMERQASRLCNCTDRACAEAVMKDMAATEQLRGTPSAAQVERAKAVASRVAECQQRLMEAGAEDPAGPDAVAFEPALRKMSEAADRLCACRDAACADRVMKELARFKEPRGKPSTDQVARAKKLVERMFECEQTLLGADRAPPPPPALE